MQRLNVLTTASRIAVVNRLEPDESPEFVLLSGNLGAIVGTDQRLFVIPEGRDAHERLWAMPYESLTNARIDQVRNVTRLLIGSEQSSDEMVAIRLTNSSQIESALQIVQDVKRRIAVARQTQQEDVSPSGQSAFIETAHRAIPGVRSTPSLSLGDMLELTPTEFEEFTGKALESLGYTNVTRVGGSGDLAADLTATDPQGRSAIVQCKRYTPGSKVGSPAVQSFIGMKSVHHRVDRGIFVTTADYSQQAIDLAKQHDIVLIDGDDLVKIAALALTPPSAGRPGQERADLQYCSECGGTMLKGAKFCGSCGASATIPAL